MKENVQERGRKGVGKGRFRCRKKSVRISQIGEG